MLTLLIGTDWTRNRNEILNRISADVAGQKGGRILIVPELISHDTERRLCKAAGDTCSRFAEVLSFSRLVKRVADYDGTTVQECLDNGGRLVAMASATKQLCSKLKAYAAVETMPEFFTGLIDMVDEFKRCCITPADLMAASHKTEGSLAQKLEELSLILEAYESVCSRGKCDPRDQMAWLLEELEVSDYGKNHIFYVDGFPDFTRQHMYILQHMARTADQVTVSLVCDEIGSKSMSFEKAGQTAAELLRFAKAESIPTEVIVLSTDRAALAPVREYLFQGDPGSQKCDKLSVLQADTLYKECGMALENVLELVHSGARYRDINIVCADVGAYRNTLEMLFEKCNIPLYISGTESVLDTPAIATVFAALEVILNGFELQDVLQYIKSMLSPLDKDTADLVENYALLWTIRGKKWEQEWTFHPNGLGEKWTDGAKNRLERLENARRTLVAPLLELRKGFYNAANLGDEIKALYKFLEDISYGKKLSAYADILEANGEGRDAQIQNQLWDILITALEQLYSVLGETAWEAENFSRLLRLLISQYDVGTIPPVLDAVSAGPVSSMRCQQCKHLILLGAEEGALPGYGGSTSLLSDQERVALRSIGIPLTGGAMDGLLAEFADIYGVICSADTSITVSTAGGEPSFVFKRLAQIAAVQENEEYCLGAAAANEMEASAYLLRRNAEKVAESLNLGDICVDLLRRRDHSLGEVSPEHIRSLFGEELRLSASQIDKMSLCRLAYFLRYGMFAEERKVAEVDPAEFGTYVHAVLEKTVERVMSLGGFDAVDADKMVGIAREFSDQYAQERFSELDAVRITYLFKRNWNELEIIVRELWAELKAAEFEPVGFEVAFGDEQDIPAIDVSGSLIRAKLRGFVDRVDRWVSGNDSYFRVVDYKTGKKSFDYCDVYNGYGLQMLLYMFALEASNADLVGGTATPAGVQYFPARVPLVSAEGQLTQEEADKARKKNWRRSGLVLLDEAVMAAMEGTDPDSGRMPDTKKKDGSVSGDLADRNQLRLLRRYVFKKVGRMVDEIASGNVTPNPYTRGTSYNACTYCPFGAVCHKATVEGRRNFKTVSSQKFWEDIEKEVGGDG